MNEEKRERSDEDGNEEERLKRKVGSKIGGKVAETKNLWITKQNTFM